jgi:hypothetical protein
VALSHRRVTREPALLEEWTASPAEYIGLIPFVDGSSQTLCRKTKTALVASPGVQRVESRCRSTRAERPDRSVWHRAVARFAHVF